MVYALPKFTDGGFQVPIEQVFRGGILEVPTGLIESN